MTRHLSEAERRAQILRAARSLFVENGYLATRMEDVAKRAHLSKGAVYFYFNSKRTLFDALIEEEHATTLSFLEAAANDPRPAAQKLIELGWQYLNYFAGLKSPPRFFLLMSEMAIRDEVIRERATEIHKDAQVKAESSRLELEAEERRQAEADEAEYRGTERASGHAAK